jgi:protein O-GlcNAc transferase
MKRIVPVLLLAASLAASAGCGPDKSIRYYNLGLDAVKRDDYNEAVRLWEESIKYRPDDPETRFNLGAALIELKRYAEAEIQLRRATELNPLDPDAQHLLGRSLEQQDKLPEAKRAYEFALSIKPTHVPSLLGLASTALKEDQNRSAENYATQAAELDPNNLEANMLLSEAYFRNGNFNAAYAQLQSARRLEPTNPDLLLLLGKAAYERRMYADALEALEAARALGTTTDELFCYLALTNLALGDTPDAEKHFRLALYKNPDNALAWKGLAETYIAGKKWNEAAEAAAKATALNPDDPETALDDAIVAMGSGEPAAAARKLEALRARPDAPEITNYYLGHAYLRLRENAKAREAFQLFAATWEGDKAIAEEARALVEQLAP